MNSMPQPADSEGIFGSPPMYRATPEDYERKVRRGRKGA